MRQNQKLAREYLQGRGKIMRQNKSEVSWRISARKREDLETEQVGS